MVEESNGVMNKCIQPFNLHRSTTTMTGLRQGMTDDLTVTMPDDQPPEQEGGVWAGRGDDLKLGNASQLDID